ncbi:hypothetical protein OS493_037781 [Desmophyllum pertusum]|uniref:Uncharacterized protein n=1 Tax=Desmophyllum pertusum TaxID=174260 RepID=A0A9W9YHR2_9CNID|nr:hypothetical protein OS493_037781 [Desmophyllum pertusum]
MIRYLSYFKFQDIAAKYSGLLVASYNDSNGKLQTNSLYYFLLQIKDKKSSCQDIKEKHTRMFLHVKCYHRTSRIMWAQFREILFVDRSNRTESLLHLQAQFNSCSPRKITKHNCQHYGLVAACR